MSDSYDPEFGTGANAHEIRMAVKRMHRRVSMILDNRPPLYIMDLVAAEAILNTTTPATLTEWEWRVIRFALERAGESI